MLDTWYLNDCSSTAETKGNEVIFFFPVANNSISMVVFTSFRMSQQASSANTGHQAAPFFRCSAVCASCLLKQGRPQMFLFWRLAMRFFLSRIIYNGIWICVCILLVLCLSIDLQDQTCLCWGQCEDAAAFFHCLLTPGFWLCMFAWENFVHMLSHRVMAQYNLRQFGMDQI